MMIIGIETKFDAAHYLPNYVGKCNRMHGHTWTVSLEICGEVDDASGMVVDFTNLKEDLKEVISHLDHHLLNGVMFNPTCENLCKFIFDQLIDKHDIFTLKIKEGEGGWARILTEREEEKTK